MLIGGSLECASTQSRALSRGRFAYDPCYELFVGEMDRG
jgi:hypothetical protein